MAREKKNVHRVQMSFRLCMKEGFQNKNMSFSPTWAEAPLCDYLPVL